MTKKISATSNTAATATTSNACRCLFSATPRAQRHARRELLQDVAQKYAEEIIKGKNFGIDLKKGEVNCDQPSPNPR